MHISTVSRVTNGKYAQTPHGLFELKRFFSTGVEQEDGSEISSEKTKNFIKDLVASEEVHTDHPLARRLRVWGEHH